MRNVADFVNPCYRADMQISGAQCRAARALVDLSQHDLADRSGVSRRTIAAFEIAERAPIPATMHALIFSLEAAGIQFIPENGGGAGVRFAKPGAGQ